MLTDRLKSAPKKDIFALCKMAGLSPFKRDPAYPGYYTSDKLDIEFEYNSANLWGARAFPEFQIYWKIKRVTQYYINKELAVKKYTLDQGFLQILKKLINP